MTFCLSKSGNSCPNREKNINSIGNINSIEKLDILKILDILKCPPGPHITSPSIQLHHCQPPLSEICRQILSPSPPFINVALISCNIDLCDLCLVLSLFFPFFYPFPQNQHRPQNIVPNCFEMMDLGINQGSTS